MSVAVEATSKALPPTLLPFRQRLSIRKVPLRGIYTVIRPVFTMIQSDEVKSEEDCDGSFFRLFFPLFTINCSLAVGTTAAMPAHFTEPSGQLAFTQASVGIPFESVSFDTSLNSPCANGTPKLTGTMSP